MEALFQVGEYGHSLAHAHDGMRRHNRMTFEHGVCQANETVEDCVGRNTSPIALLLLYPWIRELHEHRKLLLSKLEEEAEEEENKFEGTYRLRTNDVGGRCDGALLSRRFYRRRKSFLGEDPLS